MQVLLQLGSKLDPSWPVTDACRPLAQSVFAAGCIPGAFQAMSVHLQRFTRAAVTTERATAQQSDAFIEDLIH
jgi:hypothetical protein